MVKLVKKKSGKRPYRSTTRQAQAALTRERILESAARMFAEQGYGNTTIREIAADAGVVPETVYAGFGSKARLLTALIDIRLAPAGQPRVLDRPEALAMRDEPDARRLLHLFARDYAVMSARVRPVSEILRTAKAVEPEMAAVRDDIEAHRFEYMRTIAGWLAERADLQVPAKQAAQIIWTLASPDVGRMLCDVQGWTADQYAQWLEDTLAHALLLL
jgi:AcrR family transcriptional regulator